MEYVNTVTVNTATMKWYGIDTFCYGFDIHLLIKGELILPVHFYAVVVVIEA